jgi:hypothetical protein
MRGAGWFFLLSLGCGGSGSGPGGSGQGSGGTALPTSPTGGSGGGGTTTPTTTTSPTTIVTTPDDQDGDGYGLDDCDDTDRSIYPGAPEVPYDGVDQDCDDEDLVDVDGDGVAGIGAGGADCADGDPSIYPGAIDTPYDLVDQDCDGLDGDNDGDGDPAVLYGGTDCDDGDATRDGLDLDGDGVSSCVDDCDDTAPDVYARAPIVCGNGTDDDCDPDPECGLVGEVGPQSAALVMMVEVFEAEAAPTVLGADLNGDGLAELVYGLGDASVLGDVARGSVFAWGPSIRGVVSRFFPDFSMVGEDAEHGFGLAMAVGDVSGDGQVDLLVGAGGPPGATLYLGPLSGEGGIVDIATFRDARGPLALGEWTGDALMDGWFASDEGAMALEAPFGGGESLGSPVVRGVVTSLDTADLDGDGLDEGLVGLLGGGVAVATPSGELGRWSSGDHVAAAGDRAAWVFDVGLLELYTELPEGVVGPAAAVASITGLVGLPAVAGGDVNGDGAHDVLVGDPDAVAGAGRTYLLLGPFSGTVDVSDAVYRIEGHPGDGMGTAVAILGDYDGEGSVDLAVARGEDAPGALVFLGGVP